MASSTAKTPISLVSELFISSLSRLRAAFPPLQVKSAEALLSIDTSRFADFQCNSAMQIFSLLKPAGGGKKGKKGKKGAQAEGEAGGSSSSGVQPAAPVEAIEQEEKAEAAPGGLELPQSPHAAAHLIISCLPENDLLGEMTVSGPGFININLTESFLQSFIHHVLYEGVPAPPLEPRRVALDFSSPNIAKEMHVGHLRSTIIGECLARLFEFVGFECVRINHVGDWGTQFGMLIAHLKDCHPDFLESTPNLTDLVGFYKEAKKRFDEDEDFKKRSRDEVVNLQSGNEVNLKAWKLLCEVSRVEFENIYKRLGVTLHERGESTYNPVLGDIASALDGMGLLTEEENGAKTMWTDASSNCPLMIRKGDGGFTYDTTDLAALRMRIEQDKADWLVYVVDSGQSTHFDLVFAGARKAGWVPANVTLDHVGFGIVCGEDGKRLRTRSGDSVRLVDLLDEAAERTFRSMKERAEGIAHAGEGESEGPSSADGSGDKAGKRGKRGAAAGSSEPDTSLLDLKDEETAEDVSEDELKRRALAIGVSAVKYQDLKSNRLTNYIFDFDKMLTLKGNSAVYLMYAYARIRSIIRNVEERSGRTVDSLLSAGVEVALVHPSEVGLARELARFGHAVETSIRTLCPHKLCDFLYATSSAFSIFFRDCKVMGSEEEASRLLLCEATCRTMKQVFDLLGLETLERI